METGNAESERVIRSMVEESVNRFNRGDLSAVDEFWDEGADYVSVDGRFLKGRTQMAGFFQELMKLGGQQQRATVEQVRFITPELAIVDGSWTVTGARDAEGVELPPIEGRGFELAQQREGRWRFVATREMVIYRGQ
jgi:uncharacterized protein (TIGR02246 family)